MRSIIAAGLLAAMTTVTPARAEADLDRLCTMAKDVVGDCTCALDFLSRNLAPEQAAAMVELWAAESANPQRPTAEALHAKQGHAAVDATVAFFKIMTSFQIACPANRLALDEPTLLRSDVIELTGTIAGSKLK